MAWANAPASMEYDDDDMLDREAATALPNYPAYPPNLRFSISESDLEKAGGKGGDVGDTMHFATFGEVTSVHNTTDGARVELTLKQFAGPDGKFNELSAPAYICFCDYELGKLDLEADCEVGDMIHLIGEVRLEGVHRTEYSEQADLQIVSLTFEDESEESRK